MTSDSNPGLRDFQTWMQTFIVTPGSSEDAIVAAEEAAGFATGSAERLVKRSPTLNELERLMIYRRMFPLRMEEALSIDFPVCRRVLGARTFRRLVEEYVSKHPSCSWTLDHLGRQLVGFVERDAYWQAVPGLLDLVRLEQALCEIFNELDSETVSSASLGEIDPEYWPQARLYGIPALRLLRLESNSHELYQAFQLAQTLPSHQSRTTYLVCWRHNHHVWRLPLDEPAYQMLVLLTEGQPMGAALERVLSSHDVDEHEIFEWFRRWIGDGLFSQIAVSQQPASS